MTPDQIIGPGDDDYGRSRALFPLVYYRDDRGAWSDEKPTPRDIDLSWMASPPTQGQEVAL